MFQKLTVPIFAFGTNKISACHKRSYFLFLDLSEVNSY
jgi:hypothetical protein